MSGHFLRFGFVDFESEETSKAVKEAMEDCEIDGSQVTVAYAKSKDDKGRQGARGGLVGRPGGPSAARGGRGRRGSTGGNTNLAGVAKASYCPEYCTETVELKCKTQILEKSLLV